jgi:EAL domain-containing protein (putative c-di-GMP-specific phosphodiesterase class I)
VAFDGFGGDTTSLAALRDLPLRSVKIERTFSAGLDHDGPDGERNGAIVAGVVQLGHGLGLRVGVGGVETERAAQRITGLGADLLQGYLWGRPEPAGAAPPAATFDGGRPRGAQPLVRSGAAVPAISRRPGRRSR